MGSTSSLVEQSDDSPGTPESGISKTTRTHLMCLSRAQNKFAIHLFQQIAKDGKRPGNFMYAPLTLSVGLGMLYLGAKGPTRNELYKCFNLGEIQSQHLLAAYAALHWDLIRSTMPKGCILEIEVRLFAQSEYRMKPDYEAICMRYEISRLKNADFEGRPDLARKEINIYVKERTRGRICDVLPLGIIDRETKLLLVCAIYLRAQWMHQFEHKHTTKLPFYLPMKETIDVSMMNQKNNFRICSMSKLDCDVIELPFANKHVKMMVFLPKKNEGLKKVEDKFSRTVMENAESHLTEAYVDVYLPRFRYELGFLPGETLQKIGIREVYGKADLSGLDGTKDLRLSRIFHHIHIEVDECGSDSSSTTSVHTVGSDGSENPKTFKADHPFLYYIKDDRTGAILVLGKVVRPVY